MTDATTSSRSSPPGGSVSPSASLSEPGSRGRLEIADHVVERVATIAAGEVPGVCTTGSGLESVVGRQYPKAKAEVAGGHTRVRLDIAVTWPAPLGRTAASVRQHVREQLEALVGLSVDVVDVTVAKLSTPDRSDPRRVQ
ncbi:MAG: Asp23/Gls24 family envelope stress response protein [Terrabacter sp.]